MAAHFVAALDIPALQKTKQKIHTPSHDEYDEEFDVETSTEVEASLEDVAALWAAMVTDFTAGDVVSKLMAFIAQLRLCGEDTHDYLKQLAAAQGCPSWDIKLWVRTRWGSLSDCFHVVLALQKVCRQQITLVFLSRLIVYSLGYQPFLSSGG